MGKAKAVEAPPHWRRILNPELEGRFVAEANGTGGELERWGLDRDGAPPDATACAAVRYGGRLGQAARDVRRQLERRDLTRFYVRASRRHDPASISAAPRTSASLIRGQG